MNKVEAMEWAADYAERSGIFTAPKNDRGYVKDGWKEATPSEKAKIIQSLAESVVEDDRKTLGDNTTRLQNVIKEALGSLERAKYLDPLGFNPRITEDVRKFLEKVVGNFDE